MFTRFVPNCNPRYQLDLAAKANATALFLAKRCCIFNFLANLPRRAAGDTLASMMGGDEYTGLNQFREVIDQNWEGCVHPPCALALNRRNCLTHRE